ncbi:MAG: glycosyltransferase family 1 protein [Candidatus Coatesbacteria bacterium]
MRVAFDVRIMQGRPRGMGVYARNLLRAIARRADRPAITLIADSFLPDPEGLPLDAFGIRRVRGFGGLIAWEQVHLPRAAREFDLLHCPANGSPLRCRVPVIVTIHDAIFVRRFSEISAVPYPRQYAGHLYRTRVYPAALQRAAAVITVSETSRQDVIGLLRVPGERVTVTPEAVSETFRDADPTWESDLRGKFGIPGPYLLAMGAYEKRKNIPLLFEVFEHLKIGVTSPPMLILAGTENIKATRYRQDVAARGIEHLVRFLPYVSERDLKGLHTSAVAFLMPSRKEGFGLPLLEAMSVGTPVIASAIGAHREVAGDAALVLDPDDPEVWVEAIRRVSTDAPYRKRLSELSIAQAARFSWDRTADLTLGVYRKFG